MRSWLALAVLLLCVTPAFAQVQLGGNGQVGGNGQIVGTPSFTPNQISGLQVWYAADTGTNCITNGCVITAWNDKSTNADNLACTASPTLLTSAINGKPAVTFVSASSQYCTMATGINLETAVTVFVVAANSSTAAKGTFISSATDSAYDMWTCSASKEQGADESGVGGLGTGTAACDTAWHQMNSTFTSGSASLALRLGEATDPVLSAASLSMIKLDAQIGKNGTFGEFFNGDLAEIIVYNRVLTGTEIGEVENYLKGRYAI